jgi:hypothetical protein
MTDQQPALPGLDQISNADTLMEQAAGTLIKKLRDDGRLTDEHVLVCQLILDLSRAVGMSARAGKAAGMAMAARELREAIALLPKTVNDEFAGLIGKLNEAKAAPKPRTRKPAAE